LPRGTSTIIASDVGVVFWSFFADFWQYIQKNEGFCRAKYRVGEKQEYSCFFGCMIYGFGAFWETAEWRIRKKLFLYKGVFSCYNESEALLGSKKVLFSVKKQKKNTFFIHCINFHDLGRIDHEKATYSNAWALHARFFAWDAPDFGVGLHFLFACLS
jgi:hypothetical protein